MPIFICSLFYLVLIIFVRMFLILTLNFIFRFKDILQILFCFITSRHPCARMTNYTLTKIGNDILASWFHPLHNHFYSCHPGSHQALHNLSPSPPSQCSCALFKLLIWSGLLYLPHHTPSQVLILPGCNISSSKVTGFVYLVSVFQRKTNFGVVQVKEWTMVLEIKFFELKSVRVGHSVSQPSRPMFTQADLRASPFVLAGFIC